MTKAPLTADRLRQVVNYNSGTGLFAWIGSRGPKKAGSRAGSIDPNGYRYLKVDGKWYLTQRLAWLHHYGEWPERRVFFKDEDTDNCAIANLEMSEFDLADPNEKRRYGRHYYEQNKDLFRASNRLRDFGISAAQYQDLFAAQGGVCACCGQPESQTYKGERKWLAVDHCHATGEFRGLLCASCNQGIGHFNDNPEVLESAAAYLRAHAAKPKTNIIPLAGRKIVNERGK